MTEEQKKKLLESFHKVEPAEIEDNYWTDDKLRESAKKIIRRMGLDGKLQ